MKNTKWLLLLAVMAVIVGSVAWVMSTRRQAARGAASQAGKAQSDLAQGSREARSAVAPLQPEVVPQTVMAPPENPPPLKPVKASGQTNTAPQNTLAQTRQSQPPAKEPLHDPVARAALALVGADEVAEAYWYGAINDPNLPSNERQDLIEDLNEDGLSDPKHPTPDDLPLIFNRLLLIEEVGLDAMDKVNADAFQEAYKDLLNLANLAMGGGEPVR